MLLLTDCHARFFLLSSAAMITLDEYMRRERLLNADMAERVRLIRRHPTSPTPAEISHWRHGRRVPHHDIRQWIEFATGGEVAAEVWPRRCAQRAAS